MKVLVDTCVWSLSLRRRNKKALSDDEQRMVRSLAEAIQDGRVAMIGPIRQEILSGIKDAYQFERLRGALQAFQDEPIATGHYEEAARLFNLCRSRGVECGPVDILICAVAAANHWSILTNDAGLKRCIEISKAEGLAR
ncbi:MAG: PIN domain-containing protein [Terracidiphilus sp.]